MDDEQWHRSSAAIHGFNLTDGYGLLERYVKERAAHQVANIGFVLRERRALLARNSDDEPGKRFGLADRIDAFEVEN